MKHKKWILISLIGGILMIVGGISGNVSFYTYVFNFISTHVGEEAVAESLSLLLYIFGYIAAGGGVSVIIGTIFAAREQYRLGKLIIGLGAGMGLIGFCIHIVTALMAGSLAAEIMFIIYGLLGLNEGTGFAGVILTIFARSKFD